MLLWKTNLSIVLYANLSNKNILLRVKKIAKNKISGSQFCFTILYVSSALSYINNNIKLDEFDALIKIAAEMSRYLYPYIREVLKSKEDIEENSVIWNDFNNRFIELIRERYNISSIRVKKLLNQNKNDEIIIKSLLTLSFCISNQGYQKLKNFLFDF